MIARPGVLVVLSGPSGVGKGTVHRRLREVQNDIVVSVSATTRSPRPGEVDGVDYIFVNDEAFDAMIASGALLEHATYAGYRYGTPRTAVESRLQEGKVVLLDIEVQGAIQIRKSHPGAVFVMLVPPSIDELERRLRARGTEDEDAVQRRLARAREELAADTMFDIAIVNADVEQCVEDVLAFIDVARGREV